MNWNEATQTEEYKNLPELDKKDLQQRYYKKYIVNTDDYKTLNKTDQQDLHNRFFKVEKKSKLLDVLKDKLTTGFSKVFKQEVVPQPQIPEVPREDVLQRPETRVMTPKQVMEGEQKPLQALYKYYVSSGKSWKDFLLQPKIKKLIKKAQDVSLNILDVVPTGAELFKGEKQKPLKEQAEFGVEPAIEEVSKKLGQLTEAGAWIGGHSAIAQIGKWLKAGKLNEALRGQPDLIKDLIKRAKSGTDKSKLEAFNKLKAYAKETPKPATFKGELTHKPVTKGMEIVKAKPVVKPKEFYLYHGTGEEAFKKIRQEGLKGKEVIREGFKEKEIYFANKEEYAKIYGGRKKAPYGVRILRTKRQPDMTFDLGVTTGDFIVKRPVSPKDIEVKIKGKWIPIQQYSEEKINIMPLNIKKTDMPFYNIKRLGVDKKTEGTIKSTLKHINESVKKVKGGTLTHKEIIDYAKAHPEVTDSIITRETTKKMGAAQLNIRQKIKELSEKGIMTEELEDAFRKDITFSANTARLLEQRKIIPGDEKEHLIETIVRNLKKHIKVTDDVLTEAKKYDFNKKEEAINFYRKFVKPKINDWIQLLRYSSMLSSPTTHAINFNVNYQALGLSPLTRTVEGGLDYLGTKFTGKPRKVFAKEGIKIVKEYLKLKTLKSAVSSFYNTMAGKHISEMGMDVRFMPITKVGTPLRKVENVLSFPTRLLQAGDEFFHSILKPAHTEALKFRVSKGVEVKDLPLKAYMTSRRVIFNNQLGLSKDGHVLKTIEFLPKVIMKAKQSKIVPIKIIADYSFPFVRIPANIVKQGIEYSPTGFSTLWGAKNKQEQLAKALIGSAIGIATATLLGSDRLTWSEPTNPDQKALWREAGRQPYSVKIGKRWYSFTKLHPALAFNFALVSAIHHQFKNRKINKTEQETALMGLAKVGSFYAEQSYMKNLGEFMRSTKGDVEAPTKLIANYGQQFIPLRALQGWVRRIIDPIQRKPDDLAGTLEKQFQYIASQLPLFSKQISAREGFTGKPLKYEGQLLSTLTGMRTRKINPEIEKIYQISEEYTRFNRMQRDIKKVLLKEDYGKLNIIKDELKKFKSIDGDEYFTNLIELVKELKDDPDYSSMNEMEKERIINNIIKSLKTSSLNLKLNLKHIKKERDFNKQEPSTQRIYYKYLQEK